MKKIVIAPDSFKETLSALDVAHTIAEAMRPLLPGVELVEVPVADGGEGTLDALVDATGGTRHRFPVLGPLGEQVDAVWGMLGDGKTAVIEMAAASGIALVPAAQRNPLVTSTEGTGQLIRAALDSGARHFILAIGGSATNDGGTGMLRALGARFLDAAAQDLPVGGAALTRLERIDLTGFDARIAECNFEIACDVDNPLTGPRGASAVFGPQKGATPEMVAKLDQALGNYARVIREQLGREVETASGAGAAGGMGAASLAFFNGKLRRGVDIVLDACALESILAGADLVITGEGRLDGQTIFGKTPIGVAKLAKRFNLPVIAIGGCLREDVDVVHEHGIDAVFDCVHKAMPLEEALAGAHDNLARVARNIAATLALKTS
ncbi:glycerate kinase [Chitinolyticbacter albus]|uniref:glycerate kinase n=1 Tax=Chitinolyticbacter albus TaxID=2961951 RepID=UPI00210B2AA1|nr:glycerate kinase [Chitinolyticbacter albus]